MENLYFNPKLFADDTSIFSALTDAAFSNSHLNENFSKIKDCTYNSKTNINRGNKKTCP